MAGGPMSKPKPGAGGPKPALTETAGAGIAPNIGRNAGGGGTSKSPSVIGKPKKLGIPLGGPCQVTEYTGCAPAARANTPTSSAIGSVAQHRGKILLERIM